MVSIPGKHGEIRLIVPNRAPTDAEIDELHRTIAEVLLKSEQEKQKEAAL